jgi:hypothetical protein
MNGFQEALKQACAIAGIDADGARLLRLGSNAVYRLKDPAEGRGKGPGTGTTVSSIYRDCTRLHVIDVTREC